MQKLDLSNVVYLVDGSAPLWPTANGFLLSIVFHSPQRQRYKEYLKQGVLFIMNPWSFDEMQQLAVLDRSYPENTTVSCWQQKHVDVCQIVCNLFALPSARNWVSYDDHVVLCSGENGTAKEEECLAQCLRTFLTLKTR